MEDIIVSVPWDKLPGLNDEDIMCKIPNLTVGIKEMSLKHRNEWVILDHQYFTFEHMTRIYTILDIMNVTKPAA